MVVYQNSIGTPKPWIIPFSLKQTESGGCLTTRSNVSPEPVNAVVPYTFLSR